MSNEFGKDFWEDHWRRKPGTPHEASVVRAPNPYLRRETGELIRGSALDAGCGEGAEAIWLASEGWQVTAVDISRTALDRAEDRAVRAGVADQVSWVEVDLGTWDPGRQFHLVTSHYAHPAMPQLDFYSRISTWVKPGGTLLLVGHLHAPDAEGHGHHSPRDVSVTADEIVARLDATEWRIETAEEASRVVSKHGGQDITLHDVVVRATRIG